LDINGRHLGFTFFIGQMTEVMAPDIYSSLIIIIANVQATAQLIGDLSESSDEAKLL
jgi:hypothetical protein